MNEAQYRTLLQIAKQVASEIEEDDLLREAMDKVIEITGAQRGFIALLEENDKIDFDKIDFDKIAFKGARNIEKSDIENPQCISSRNIIARVISKNQTIYSPDATLDPEFAGSESIERLQLRSVICTPILYRDRPVGLIYVDNTKESNLFDTSVAELLTEFSQWITIALKNTSAFSKLKQSHQQQLKALREKYHFEEIIGEGQCLTQLLQEIADGADNNAPVLIVGESGTGKESIAEALHKNSSRTQYPFIVVNCAAIPESLVESELFGYKKGSFTGADADKKGKFALAEGGTIFLDEIGELPNSIQAKLLRVLQKGTFSRIGGEEEEEQQCDVRVIAATNRNLNEMIKDGSFREDLYYRLNVIDISVPLLRERREDILLLVNHFLKRYVKNDKLPQISKSAKQLLLSYDYPGNIRELENAIRRAVIYSKGGQIEVEHLTKELRNAKSYGYSDAAEAESFFKRRKRAIELWEKNELEKLLALTGGFVRKAAKLGKVGADTFIKMLKKYKIDYRIFRSQKQ
jgi:transcriptional regulator with GAF, ATPase, and Fis domain